MEDPSTELTFHLIGRVCETENVAGCLGIIMEVRYDADGEQTLERISDADVMRSATSSWYSAGSVDGETPSVGITRFVILDGGMTTRNVKDNLLNLLSIAPRVADYVWQAGEYAPAE